MQKRRDLDRPCNDLYRRRRCDRFRYLDQTGVIIKGQTTIKICVDTAASPEIEDSKIGNQVTIKASTIEESIIHDGADVGPNAHLRPHAEIFGHTIRNFVKSKMSRRLVKAPKSDTCLMLAMRP